MTTPVILLHNEYMFLSLLTAAITSISIVSPQSNQVITGDQVTLRVAVPEFRLVDFRSYPRSAAGQGHLHIWIDQKDFTKASAIKTASNIYTLPNLKPGKHAVTVELVNNDHSSLNPRVISTTAFSTVSPKSNTQSSPVILLLLTLVLLFIALFFLVKQKPLTKSKKKTSKK